jgi:nitrogen fixation protein NifB
LQFYKEEHNYVTKVHPCFSHTCHTKYARIHIPVAPRCNIQCNYCERGINTYTQKPGFTSKVLTPIEALKVVKKVVEDKDKHELSVVGVAGPGDALANEETFTALKLIHARYPWLLKCVATNGLELPNNVNRLLDCGVKAITVTVNAVDPIIASRIYEYITFKGEKQTGIQATQTLILNQLKGIELSSRFGLCVKVNTVLIPKVNDMHVAEVAETVARHGAFIMNIIPLIPGHKFKHLKPPTNEEIKNARKLCSKYITQFNDCKLCRADAYGIPGLEAKSNKEQLRCCSA